MIKCLIIKNMQLFTRCVSPPDAIPCPFPTHIHIPILEFGSREGREMIDGQDWLLCVLTSQQSSRASQQASQQAHQQAIQATQASQASGQVSQSQAARTWDPNGARSAPGGDSSTGVGFSASGSRAGNPNLPKLQPTNGLSHIY